MGGQIRATHPRSEDLPLKFHRLNIPGAFRVELEPFSDERGLFARTFCKDEFYSLGIDFPVAQCSTSFNKEAGTLRGMHFQKSPFAEKKLVRCTAGAVYDVILDLRPDSPSYLKWEALELSAANRFAVFIPEGVAHGFQTLAPASEIFYQMSVPFHAEYYAGVRWNDPAFGIHWPEAANRTVSPKDASYAGYVR